MISIDKNRCCGCSACVQICRHSCITMLPDKEGFLYPVVINPERCVNCGLCAQVCPYYVSETQASPLKCYSFVHRDSQIRNESSSGGLFSAFSQKIINEGGIVFAVRFDDNWDTVVSCTDKIEDLFLFRGSKYVQARVSEAYIHIRKELQSGRKVLFCGTPCQVKGLNSFLRKRYSNLYTVDFVCHSIPSPRVWHLYLKAIADGRQLEDITFRDKSANGWHNYSLKITSMSNKTILSEGKNENLYMLGFLKDLYNRPSCSNCPARGFSSGSDIMIGDFWHVEKYHSSSIYTNDEGVSMAISLTPSGQKLIEEVTSMGTIEDVDIAEIELNGVHNSILVSPRPHQLRPLFFLLYEHVSILPLIEFCIEVKRLFKKIIGG